MSTHGLSLPSTPSCTTVLKHLTSTLDTQQQALQSLEVFVNQEIETFNAASNDPEKAMVDRAIALHVLVSGKLQAFQALRVQIEEAEKKINASLSSQPAFPLDNSISKLQQRVTTSLEDLKRKYNVMVPLEARIIQQLLALEGTRDAILKAYREKTQGVDGVLTWMFTRQSELERYQALSCQLAGRPPQVNIEDHEKKEGEVGDHQTPIRHSFEEFPPLGAMSKKTVEESDWNDKATLVLVTAEDAQEA